MNTDTVLEAILSVLERAGGTRIDPPTLLEARVLIDLSGEAVRPRLCRFARPDGTELCLRPDMTVPITSMSFGQAHKVHYSGPVWLYPQTRADASDIEVPQAGFEWFADPADLENHPAQDAKAIALTLEAAAHGGIKQARLSLSDMGLWRAVIAALELPESWRDRLGAANHWRGGIPEVLNKADTLSPLVQELTGLTGLTGLTQSRARQRIAQKLEQAKAGDIGRRHLADIEQRLQGFLIRDELPKAARQCLFEFSQIKASPTKAMAQIKTLADQAGLNIDAALQRFALRLDALQAHKPPLFEHVDCVAISGGRFDYYDGVMFELSHASLTPDQVLARGGRYDALARRLGRADLAAVGAALRPDRLALAARAEQGAA